MLNSWCVFFSPIPMIILGQKKQRLYQHISDLAHFPQLDPHFYVEVQPSPRLA